MPAACLCTSRASTPPPDPPSREDHTPVLTGIRGGDALLRAPGGPRNLAEAVGQWIGILLLASIFLAALGLAGFSRCGDNDLACVGASGGVLAVAMLVFLLAMWALPGGRALEARREAARQESQGLVDLRESTTVKARPLEPPKRGPTLVRAPGGGWEPLRGMACPRCGGDTVWDGEVSKWWCLAERAHF
jgi:hypothetical protein